MTSFNIVKFPSAILKKEASKVAHVGEAERTILSEMVKAMYINRGVGLAAVQVGISKQLAVIDVGEGVLKMINPVIVKKEGKECQEEGCLSVPGAVVKVKRAKKILVQFLNESGEAVQLKADGLCARAIQHEVDHLSGKLIIDYLNPVKKLLFKKSAAISKKFDTTSKK